MGKRGRKGTIFNGMKFGMLTVTEKGETKGTNTKWVCRCGCGNIVSVYASNLMSGNTTHCGCQGDGRQGRKIHGMGNTRLYHIWGAMIQRCKGNNEYFKKHYRNRGITVCVEWLDFNNFMAWALSNGYRDDLTIDREDNDGNYEPGNCRWVDMMVQGNNRSNNVRIEIDGEEHTLAEWCRITGTKRVTADKRMERGLTGKDIFAKVDMRTLEEVQLNKRDKALIKINENRMAKLIEIRKRFGLEDAERSGRMAQILNS